MSCGRRWPSAGGDCRSGHILVPTPPPDTRDESAQRHARAAAALLKRHLEHEDREADSSMTLRHRTQSFARCVSSSQVLELALLSMELSGSHPPAGANGSLAGLEWTLAQMLALHLRTRAAEATDLSLLAALWLIDAPHGGGSRSSPGVASCLDRMQALAPVARLLHKLKGQVSLDAAKDVWPCLQILFTIESAPQHSGEQASSPAYTKLGSGVGYSTPWARDMHDFCIAIRDQAWAQLRSADEQQQEAPASHGTTATASSTQQQAGCSSAAVGSVAQPASTAEQQEPCSPSQGEQNGPPPKRARLQ